MNSLDLSLNPFPEYSNSRPEAKTVSCFSSEPSFASVNENSALPKRIPVGENHFHRSSGDILRPSFSSHSKYTEESQSEYSQQSESGLSNQCPDIVDSNPKRRASLPDGGGYQRFKMSDQSISQGSNICKFCDSRFLSPLELECHLSFHLKELRKRFPEEYEKLIKRRTTGTQALSAEFKRPRFSSAPTFSDDSKLRKVNSETTVELLNLLVALNEKANEAKSKSNKLTVSLDFARPRFSIANGSSSLTDESSGSRGSLPRTSSHVPINNLQKKEFTFETWDKKSQSAEFPRPNHHSHHTNYRSPNIPMSSPHVGTQEKMHFPEPCCKWYCSYFSLPCKQNNLPTWCKPEYQIPGPHRDDIRTVFNPNAEPQMPVASSPSPSSSISHNLQQNINFSMCSLSGLQEHESRMSAEPTYSSSSQKTKDDRMKVDSNPADMANPENLEIMARAWLDGAMEGMDDDVSVQDSDSMLDLSLHL